MSPLREITTNKIKSLDRLYLCDYCKLGFDNESALQAHAREHETPAGNQCGLCESGFSSKWNLRRHIERRHRLAGGQEGVKVKEEREDDEVRAEPEDEESKENKSEITAVCDICNKGFRGRCGKQNMERHRENIHADKTKTKKEEELEEEKHQIPVTEEEEEVKVTDLDIVTDYYNRLIIELSLQRYTLSSDVN